MDTTYLYTIVTKLNKHAFMPDKVCYCYILPRSSEIKIQEVYNQQYLTDFRKEM